MSNPKKFPPGWDEERGQRVLAHYESQTEKEAVAEDVAAFNPSKGNSEPVPQS